MAEPHERFGRTYHYNGAGEWIVYDANGGIIDSTTLDAISNGTLTMRGTTVFQVSPWRILWNVPATRDAMVTPTSSGRLLFSNGIERDNFNRELGPTSVYSAAGQYEVTVSEGEVVSFRIDYMNLTAIGNSLYINDSIYGKGRFIDVPNDLLGTDYEDELLARGYRPAEAEDAIDRSAVSYLLRYYREELEKIFNHDLDRYLAGGIKTVYQFAQALASVSGGDLDIYISRLYDPAME